MAIRRLMLVAAFLHLFASGLAACSCAGSPTMCESLTSASTAFIGTVLRGTEVPGERKAGTPGEQTPAVLRVELIVRGLPAQTLEVEVNPMIHSSCYFPLLPEQRWLILGGVIDGKNTVMTGTCSGSTQLKPNNATAVERMARSFVTGPNLFLGNVRRNRGWNSPWRTDNLVDGAKVTLNGPDRTWTATTSADGRFEVSDHPPGEYQFQVQVPGLSMEEPADDGSFFNRTGTPTTFQIAALGCHEARAMMWPDQHISGTVRTAIDSHPLAGVLVEAYRVQPSGETDRSISRITRTSANGTYVLPRLIDGTYRVGIGATVDAQQNPARVTYAPAAQTKVAGRQVVLAGNSVDGVDVAVTPERIPVKVNLRLVSPDGTPAGQVLVELLPKDRNHQCGDASGFSHTTTGPSGVVEIPLLASDSCLVQANWSQRLPGTEANGSPKYRLYHLPISPLEVKDGSTTTLTLIPY